VPAQPPLRPGTLIRPFSEYDDRQVNGHPEGEPVARRGVAKIPGLEEDGITGTGERVRFGGTHAMQRSGRPDPRRRLIVTTEIRRAEGRGHELRERL